MSEPDVNARRAAVEEGLRLLSSDAPVVPLFFSNRVFASRTAAFKDWVFVEGTAAIDERSFTDPPLALPRPSAEGVEIEPETTESRMSILRLVAISLIASAAILGVADLLRRHLHKRF